ncbi:MAG: hypothetical protein JST81_07290 [Bacteroidetes bacterium]|nr:hypothetical protein [Bacteroidota bacterium]
MIHTYENACRICKAYKDLISSYNEKGSSIIDVCVIPADLKQLSHFLEHYKTRSAEEALQLSGYDPNRVRIVVIHEQSLRYPSFMLDLDEYLTRHNIEKKYDQVTKSFLTLN